MGLCQKERGKVRSSGVLGSALIYLFLQEVDAAVSSVFLLVNELVMERCV